MVFHEADPAETVHLVAEGRLAARRSTPTGDTLTFAILGPGDTFGEMAMLGSQPRRTSTVVALEPAVTLSLGFGELERLRSAHPGSSGTSCAARPAGPAAVGPPARGAARAGRRAHRAAALRGLRPYAPRRAPHGGRPPHPGRVGELAGASRPTTNRVLRGLVADGIVALHRGSIEVLDLVALASRGPRPERRYAAAR